MSARRLGLAGITVLAVACRPGAAAPVVPTAAHADDTWQGNPRVPDFSFAGYHMSGGPLPRVPAVTDARKFGAKGDGVTDDTQALQRALDATNDGALVLPAGRYVLGDAIHLPRSHVVLRGEGPDKTILVVPRSLTEVHPPGDPLASRFHGFVEVRGSLPEIKLGDVASPAQRGDRQLRLSAPTDVKAGELVRVRMANADGLLRTILGGGLEPGPQTPKDYDYYVDWVVPIAKAEGSTLTLTRPLRLDVRPEWKAEILAFQPTIEEVGIEDLSFEFPGTPKKEHLEEEGFNAIYIRTTTNAWVRNVTVTDADNGIVLEDCRSCQVEAVQLRAAKRTVPSGHHALWAKESQDCLFSDFHIETEYEHDLTVEAFANGNVFMRGTGQAMSLDHHRNAPYENLFTDLDVGSPAHLWKSGGDRDRGPHAGARETLWNVRHRGHPMTLPGAADFDKRVDAGWPLLNLVQIEGYAPTTAGDNVWVYAAPGGPPNLYEAQLRARRGR